MHKTIEPAILYFGTPVVLVSTRNKDGSTNIAPISSIWWLGWSCMIGLDASSQTTENLIRTNECVLNMPSVDLSESVNALAKTTGRQEVPLHKRSLGYKAVHDKFSIAGLSQQLSEVVAPMRVKECPVQLEATLQKVIPFGEKSKRMAVASVALELNIEKVHIDDSILKDNYSEYVDPDKWQPLIMSFRKLYTTGPQVGSSKLAEGEENKYAPWKQTQFKKHLIQWALNHNNKKYKIAIKKNKKL